MLPTTIDTSEETSDFEIKSIADQPTKTYCMDLEQSRMKNYADGQGAMKQAIFKILQTERYDHPEIYSDNYGVEFKELIGRPIAFVVPEIERRIKEALLWDERIESVTDFSFSLGKNEVLVAFKAHTIFGTVDIENVGVYY